MSIGRRVAPAAVLKRSGKVSVIHWKATPQWPGGPLRLLEAGSHNFPPNRSPPESTGMAAWNRVSLMLKR